MDEQAHKQVIIKHEKVDRQAQKQINRDSRITRRILLDGQELTDTYINRHRFTGRLTLLINGLTD